jgi:hypothetical protein
MPPTATGLFLASSTSTVERNAIGKGVRAMKQVSPAEVDEKAEKTRVRFFYGLVEEGRH